MNADLKILKTKYAINLFEWYRFENKETKKESDSSILVLGDCDENLIVPLSKRVKQVDVILSAKEYVEPFSYVALDNNVKIYDKLINEFEFDKFDKKYDFILIPSLTKDIYDISNKSLSEFLIYWTDRFTNHGQVLLAFDNSISMENIEGSKMDLDFTHFSYEDINQTKSDLYEKYNNFIMKLYFPMPEYKFPIRIYSERYLPNLDDEDQRTRNLVTLGKFKEFCPSYFMVFISDSKDVLLDKSVIYAKYNIDRKKQFAIRTSIEEVKKDKSETERIVIKKALYPEANEHVLSLNERANSLHIKNIEVLKPSKIVNNEDTIDNKAYVEYPFIDGETLSTYIVEKIKKGVSPIDLLDYWMNKVIGKESGIIENYNLDCTFSNVIVKDKQIFIIDGEWIDSSSTEVNFLKYRIMKYFYGEYKQYLPFESLKDLLSNFNITRQDIERYENAENEFQRLIHTNINELEMNKYSDNKLDVSKYYYMVSEYERVKGQLNKIIGEESVLDTLSRRQNDIIRLDQVHIGNLEAKIADLNNYAVRLTDEIHLFAKREALIYKVARKIKSIVMKILPEESKKRKIAKYIYRTIRHPFKMLKTFLTKSGRNRIIGDFTIGDVYFECGRVKLPKCDNPKVSIVIPCYNQIKYTYKCLYSIMNNTDANEIPYEVILADDVSTDTTKNIKKYVENIVVSRNEENLGFLKNCNKAASLAKGQYIYFLNNDTEVRPNYLKSLVDLIESDFTIGMVGSKLVFANGQLQEAGGIIWSDGTGANYGRGDATWKPEYNYVKEVDYISGAAIMIRKSLWDDIGGFDERYTPAYCEDSDLAFEVRKRGMKVVYNPKSEIIHYEGISNGTDVDDKNSIKAYQVENNKKLKEKWEDVLINHFPKTDNPNFFKARERNFDKKTILIIDHYVPTWDKDAGSKTTFYYIKMFLKKGFVVKFLGDNYVLNSPYGDILQSMGVEVLFGNDYRAEILNYLKNNKKNIDFVYLNRPYIAIKYIDYIRENMNSKIIYYGHDLHYMRMQREFEYEKDYNILEEAKYYKNLEYSLIYKSDMSYYPSKVEVDEIHKVDENLKVKDIVAYIYDKVDLDRRDWENTNDLLFVGGFAHKPNVDAIKWFDEAIYPRIKARNPNIRLKLVGSNPTDEIIEIAKKSGYELLGYVSDEELNNLYKTSRIVIAPLRYGAGIKGKIIEAMSKGSAIVTTECGAEGIKDADKFLKIADSAQEFAHAIVKLFDDFDELHKLSYYARKEINQNWTMDSAWEIIESDFQ